MDSKRENREQFLVTVRSECSCAGVRNRVHMKVGRTENAMNCADRVILRSLGGLLSLPGKMAEVEVGKNRS